MESLTWCAVSDPRGMQCPLELGQTRNKITYMPTRASSNLISSLLPLVVTGQLHHIVTHRDSGSLLENLFRSTTAFAVIHVDILHGDEGDAVFLSIGCGTAFRKP